MTNLAYKIDPASIRYTVEEYLVYDREAEIKSEYFDGRIEMMSGGKPLHSLLAARIARHLGNALDGSSCEVYNSDLRVQSYGRHFYYPDVSVVCGDLEFYEDTDDVVTNPVVIVEVLSPSTEINDRVVKWGQYQKMPSLRHYLLVWQTEPTVEQFFRDEEGEWRYEKITGEESVLWLRSLNISLLLGHLYANVPFPTAAEEAADDESRLQN